VDSGLDDLAMHRVIDWEIALAVLLVAGALLYVRGIGRLWRKAGVGRGIRRVEPVCFALGWGTLALALFSPIDEWAERSFAVHMVQHELLMVVAAPLIVLGRPLETFAWSAPAVARLGALQALWRSLTSPVGAWSVHALAIWIWHVPALFELALNIAGWHVAQHVSFFVSALAFWWVVFAPQSRTAGAWAIANLFTTMLHTSALGALLTFAPSAWYPLGEAPPLRMTPLEDQQLGGLVMWVPGGFTYMIAGLALVRRWLVAPRDALPVAKGSRS
jgi:putative membrane protein